MDIVGGISFFITIGSANFCRGITILLYIVAVIITVMGIRQLYMGCKSKYNYEVLYKDIKKLSTSENQYSLVAILNEFEGDSANKVLLQYYVGGWQTYMFLSFLSAPKDDENNVITRVAADLKVKRSQLEIRFLTEIPYQPKYSPDHQLVRMYHNKYYQVTIKDFPNTLKRTEFTLDGVQYKWMTLQEMRHNDNIMTNNADVVSVFEKYIFNAKKTAESIELIIPKSIYIRLNQICNLSCQFCLADKKSSGLSLNQLKIVLNALKMYDVKTVKLTGGEPTLYHDFFEIIKYSLDLGFNVVVYSNLYVSKDMIRELVKYPISIVTSIHGDEKFHDSITQKGAYRKTYKNILKLTSENIPVTLHMVLMNKNFELAESVIEEAIRAGVTGVTFQTLIPRGKGANLFEKGESIVDIREKLTLLYPLKNKYESSIQIKFSDLYTKACYVVETDGAIYLEKDNSSADKLIRGLI